MTPSAKGGVDSYCNEKRCTVQKYDFDLDKYLDSDENQVWEYHGSA